MQYHSKVFKGDQTGRKIGFPTVNLDPKVLPQNFPQGIYASLVTHNGKEYKGALYFGPRLVMNEQQNVLEIFILEFDKEIYGETVSFQTKNFIRPIQNFSSLDAMKLQLEKDIEQVEKALKEV